MMLIEASWPSNRLAAVTNRTGCVGDVQLGTAFMLRGYGVTRPSLKPVLGTGVRPGGGRPAG